MDKGRVEAFSDGVVAIIITIMVLDMKVPATPDMQGLVAAAPVFLGYALSYANVGIFWNNHHHMLHTAEHVDGQVLWSNLFLLFWLSLVPFLIRWIDDSHLAPLAVAAYGVDLAVTAVAYNVLQWALIACNGGAGSNLSVSVGADLKGKLSIVAYVAGAALAFVSPWIAVGVYVCVALSWFIPDRRIESRMKA